MARHLVLSGLVGGLLAASSWTVMAQEAQKPASGGCSGFMCGVFGSKIEERPATAAAPAPETPVAATPDVADPADPSETNRPRKVAAKPVPTVTIAADAAEAARLKALVASLPKTHIHIVASDGGKPADFTVAPAVDGTAPSEKARLFTEQLHIVAGPDVRSVNDLTDKVVSFGTDRSPAQAAARKAFAALGVSVKETPLDLDNALDGIATGDVAATIVLAPQPDSRLARLKTTSGLHLVSWPEGVAMPEGISVTTIPGSAYPGLARAGDTIRVIGIEAALDASGRGATSPAAKAFLIALAQHSATLSKRGFDLIKADLETRNGRRVASVERR